MIFFFFTFLLLFLLIGLFVLIYIQRNNNIENDMKKISYPKLLQFQVRKGGCIHSYFLDHFLFLFLYPFRIFPVWIFLRMFEYDLKYYGKKNRNLTLMHFGAFAWLLVDMEIRPIHRSRGNIHLLCFIVFLFFKLYFFFLFSLLSFFKIFRIYIFFL